MMSEMKMFWTLAVAAIACGAFAQATAEKKECCQSKAVKVSTKVQAKESCCQEKAAKAVKVSTKVQEKEACATPGAKAECCNTAGKPAFFKVFVANEGYKFFGCKDSAKKGRETFVAEGKTVGSIQKVTSKKSIG